MKKAALSSAAVVVALLAGSKALAADLRVVDAANTSAPVTLRCRPQTAQHLTSCAIFLPQGEKVNPDKIVADSKRWLVVPETYGPGGASSVVFVKERTDEVGISTTIYLMTDARNGLYRIIVVADANAPIFSEVHFEHRLTLPQQRASAQTRATMMRRQQADALASAATAKAKADAAAAYAAILAKPCTARVDARYTWNAASIAPTAVFLDDEGHTCVQFALNGAPMPLPYIGVQQARFQYRTGDRMMIVDGAQASFELQLDGQTVRIRYMASSER